MAILHFYDGRTIDQAAALTRRSPSSVKRYLQRWNKEGFEGLVPQFDGGPKPRIDGVQWKEILGEIEGKGMTMEGCPHLHKKDKGCQVQLWWSLEGVQKKAKDKVRQAVHQKL